MSTNNVRGANPHSVCAHRCHASVEPPRRTGVRSLAEGHSLGKTEAQERRMTRAGACSMLDGFVLFDENRAYVRLFASIASARHSCPALATELFVPRKIWVVFADPPYAKTNGTVFIHCKKLFMLARSFLIRERDHPRTLPDSPVVLQGA
jgi:16S rRNA G966 N2-methylase RsmD